MNTRLKTAIHALQNLDRSLKPVQLANAREDALIEGLHGLAAEFGREIEFTRIDARGEMDFNISGGERYGDELAAWVSRVPRRTGIAPYDGPELGVNSWCRINHFDVERLLNIVAAEMPGLDNSEDAGADAPRP